MRHALDNLKGAGFSFLRVMQFSDERRYLKDADDAHAYMLNPARGRDPYFGQRLELMSMQTFYRLYTPDEVGAVDFFHVTGDRRSVKNPALAESVKSLEAAGIRLEAVPNRLPSGACGAYVALSHGEAARIRIGGASFGEVQGTSPETLEQSMKTHGETISVYRDVLAAAATAGRIEGTAAASALSAVAVDVSQTTLRQRAEAFLRVSDALNEGRNASHDSRARGMEAIDAYKTALAAVSGDDFEKRVDEAAWLARHVDADQFEAAAHQLATDPSPFRQLAQAGLPTADAISVAARLRDTDDVDGATARFASAYLLSRDVDAALQVALTPPTAGGTIERTAGEVSIGGIRVPVRG